MLDAFGAWRTKRAPVELLAETSHHSLAWLASPEEFAPDALHRRQIVEDFGRNLAFSATVAHLLRRPRRRAGGVRYAGVLADGVAVLLGTVPASSLPRGDAKACFLCGTRDFRTTSPSASRTAPGASTR